MKKIVLNLLLCGVVMSCGIKDKATESLAENFIEKATGMEMDIENIANIEDQKTDMDLSWDGRDFPDAEYMTSITAIPDVLNIIIRNDELALLVNLSSKDLKTRPLIASAKMNTEGNTVMVSVQDYVTMEKDYDQGTFMNQDGEVRITELSKDRLTLELDVKLANPTQSENPESWKTLKGKITCTKPMFNSMGQNLESILD